MKTHANSDNAQRRKRDAGMVFVEYLKVFSTAGGCGRKFVE